MTKKHLVIVESPSKAKTIEKYLGSDYKVVSSKGHIRDLALTGRERMGIDVDHDFETTYKVLKDKKDVVKELSDLAKKSQDVILASDPDREGEAIAWHLATQLGLPLDASNRIVFHEVTKPAVLKAIQEPHPIDMNLVNSQETRRMLDRIIGFKLSRLLQKKIHSKSAGRVQSVALRLIVERENEIKKFKSEEYWTIHASITKGRRSFEAQLAKVKGKKPKISSEEEARNIVAASAGDFVVSSVTRRKKKKPPKLPFTTSTLQQESSSRLGYGARKTMTIAQKLYEGVEIDGTPQGLISYMRTDSTRLSPLFVNDAEKHIEEVFGRDYRGSAHEKNATTAQDAHEAIRPTNIANTPEKVKPFLTAEQYKLYSLIYARTIASLMADAVFDSTSVKLLTGDLEYTASGQTLVFDGYTKAYGKYEKQTETVLPPLEQGEVFQNVPVDARQHFTEPPARYTEAKLIKELEEKSIGRPSTYASIIDTLQKRGYVTLEKASETGKTKVFFPTQQGVLTDESLQQYFSDVINVKYTADMEKTLDTIAEGDEDHIEYMHHFYDGFAPLVEDAYEKMPVKELEQVGRPCPECGGQLVFRNGRFGRFISCANFPTCKYTESEQTEEVMRIEEEGKDKTCPNCGGRMVLKKGRYGLFWACSNYPACKTIEGLEKDKPQPTGEKCPECGGDLVKRKSRFGTWFVGCSNYPACHYIKKEPKKSRKKEEPDAQES